MVTTRARAPSNASIAAPKTAAKSKSSAKTKKPTATPKKVQPAPKKVPNRKKLESEDLQPETANADNLVEQELLDSLKEEYESKIDKLQREYESEKRTVEKLEEDNNELSSAKNEYSAQIVLLNEKINEYKKQLAENQQNDELEKFNQALQSENKRLKDEFELKNNEHMLQSATIIKVEQDLAHESIKNNELCSKITELMSQLTNREGELEARTASYKYHKEITEKLESEINELRASFANKVNEMNQLEKDLSNIKNSFNSQGVQFATLKTQFESKVNSLENQLTDANASKKKYHEALESLQKDNESLFSSTTKQINQMMADYELRLQQNSEAKYGMPELFEKLDETSKKNIQEIFKLQENINSSQKKYDSLMQKFEASQTELNSSKSKILNLQNEVETLKQKNHDFSSEIEKLKAMPNQAQIVSKPETDENHLEMCHKNDELKAENKELRDKLISLSKNLAYEQQKNQMQNAPNPMQSSSRFGPWGTY